MEILRKEEEKSFNLKLYATKLHQFYLSLSEKIVFSTYDTIEEEYIDLFKSQLTSLMYSVNGIQNSMLQYGEDFNFFYKKILFDLNIIQDKISSKYSHIKEKEYKEIQSMLFNSIKRYNDTLKEKLLRDRDDEHN